MVEPRKTEKIKTKSSEGKKTKTSSKNNTANKDKSIRSKTTKNNNSTKRQKGGNIDNCSYSRYKDEKGFCPDDFGRYDKVETFKLNITDNQNDKHSPLEQIPEKISVILTEKNVRKNVRLDSKNYHQAVLSTEAFEGLNDNDKVTFLNSYKFWDYCFIDTNYMNSTYNVMIMPPSVIMLRGIEATCDTVKAPHNVEDKYQQLPCWFSDMENASIYSKDKGHVWCYTSIRPLILFELTDQKSLETLFNTITEKGDKVYDEVTRYDQFSDEMKRISSPQNAEVEALKEAIIDCLLILPDNTPFLDKALDAIEEIDVYDETSKILQTIQSTVDRIGTIVEQLKTQKNQLLQKYANSLDIIKATTGITIDTKTQYSMIKGINIKYVEKPGDLWNNKSTINRVSYHPFDFKLVEIIKEHLPWCDGYYGRKVCSTYHKYFHREVCIFGTHGKMKLMRSINPCKPINAQKGGSIETNTFTNTFIRNSDKTSTNNSTYVENLKSINNNTNSKKIYSTMSQQKTFVSNKDQNVAKNVTRKMTNPLSWNYNPSVNVDVLTYSYSMVDNSMFYNKLAELYYDNIIMDFQKSYLCNHQKVDKSTFQTISLDDTNIKQ